MTNIDLAQLATVVGGTQKAPVKPKAKLHVRKVGGVSLIGNESEKQFMWDEMPQ